MVRKLLLSVNSTAIASKFIRMELKYITSQGRGPLIRNHKSSSKFSTLKSLSWGCYYSDRYPLVVITNLSTLICKFMFAIWQDYSSKILFPV